MARVGSDGNFYPIDLYYGGETVVFRDGFTNMCETVGNSHPVPYLYTSRAGIGTKTNAVGIAA